MPKYRKNRVFRIIIISAEYSSADTEFRRTRFLKRNNKRDIKPYGKDNRKSCRGWCPPTSRTQKNTDENFHRDSFKCVVTIGLVFRHYVCVQKLKRHTAISRAPKNTDRLHHTIFHRYIHNLFTHLKFLLQIFSKCGIINLRNNFNNRTERVPLFLCNFRHICRLDLKKYKFHFLCIC